MNLYLAEYFSMEAKHIIIGIFTTLPKAKKAHSLWLSDRCLITKIPADKLACKINDGLCADNLGRLDHWHYDPEDKIWRQ